ncbi:hypothetical protein DIC66_06505 [Rhodoferax lacus]|uniref:TolC family protein n=1 Tax=Rhodoferax lacus TaxID=2184758 RepID=A0A3E1RFY1_9BURK|nr:TolC family protein [Rhodoferax lacus]RFO97520.1 hypothetical protein DIC66_06505 [Rhodoferax lacus]
MRLNRLLGIGILLGSSTAFTAEPPPGTASEPLLSRPNKTLTAAAAAAAAASQAAGAAATAAAAAAAAASAAVDAVNAVMGNTRRVAPISAEADAAAMAATAADQAAETAAMDTGKNNNDEARRFTVPSERSLIGIAGAFEVQVFTRSHATYVTGLSSMEGVGAEPATMTDAIDLAQAVKASLGFNRDVLAAGAKLDQAVAQTGQAKAFLLPSLVLNLKSGQERSEPGVLTDPATGKVVPVSDHNRSDSSLTLKQPLYDGPSFGDWKRRQVIERSRMASQSASVGDAYLSTVNAYLSLSSSRILSDMAQDYQVQLDELFKYVDKRAAAGVSSNSDKERVRARSLNAQSARLEQESAHAAAGVEFVRLVNVVPGSLRLPEPEDVGLSVVPASLDTAITQALQSNPDIAAADAEVRAAQLDLDAASKRFLPRLDLEYSANESVHAGGAAGSQKDQRLMLSLNWALFSGYGDRRFNDEKAARYNELKYKLDDQRRKVLQTLTSQYAQLGVTRKRIASGYLELQSTASAARAVSNRMLSGNQSLLDVLDVFDRYYQVRVRLVNLHVLEISSLAQIARLLQGSPNREAGWDTAAPVASLN